MLDWVCIMMYNILDVVSTWTLGGYDPEHGHGYMIRGRGVPIFQTNTMNYLLLETKLRMNLVLYLVIGALLNYIDILFSTIIFFYSL